MLNPLPGPSANLEALRPFASVRLIVADLDGTLFPSDVVATAQRLLRQLNRAGVRLTLATGRTICGVRQVRAKLRESPERSLIKRGTPLILYNGSVVVDAETGELLKRCSIPDSVFQNVLDSAARYSCEVFAYFCEQDILQIGDATEATERVMGWQFGIVGPRSEYEFNGSSIDWLGASRATLPEPCAILIRASEPAMLATMSADIGRLDGVSVTTSGSAYLELRPSKSHKGAALAWVAQRLALAPSEVLAVGDNDNDAEMLQWAGIGVAINTASRLAKANADFQSHLGPFQGVIEVLRLVHQAHRYFRSAIHHPKVS